MGRSGCRRFAWLLLLACGCGGSNVDPGARDAAKWVLEAGGTLVTFSSDLPVTSQEELPEGEFGIRSIDLAESKIRNRDLEQLAGLEHLQLLNLYQTNVTNDGLDKLTGLKSLESLELSYTRVTDKGLPTLAELPKLQKLFLYGTAVTDEGVEAAFGEEPSVKIIR